MGKRLTKISTRTGDDGTTGLADGSRISKDGARIEALGTIDELNSALGLVLANDLPASIRGPLQSIQNDLFDIGGELAIPGHAIVTDAHVGELDVLVESLNATLPPLREFILPGGSRASADTHLARTICRRAERRVVTLGAGDIPNPAILQYLNRLSDVLFVMARVLNSVSGVGDVFWKQGASRKDAG